MSLAYIRNVETGGPLQLHEIIEIDTGATPPPRPHPQPPEPPSGAHPAFPIAGGPDPGWPDKPGYPDYITGWPVPPGEQPPTEPPLPDAKGDWKYGKNQAGETGWFFVGVIGPMDKPKPA